MLFHPPAMGHVLEGGNRRDERTPSIPDWCRVHAQNRPASVRSDDLDLLASHGLTMEHGASERPFRLLVWAAVGMKAGEPAVVRDAGHRTLVQATYLVDGAVPENHPARRCFSQYYSYWHVVDHCGEPGALRLQCHPGFSLRLTQPGILGDEARLPDLLGQAGDLDRRSGLVRYRGEHRLRFG